MADNKKNLEPIVKSIERWPDYSKSTFSGADISVLATFNPAYFDMKFKSAPSNLSLGANSANPNQLQLDPEFQAPGYLDPGDLNLSLDMFNDIELLEPVPVELGTVQTVSMQTHRPKAAVRSLGRSYVKGYTRGPRTIAGSMIFTVLNKQALHNLCAIMDEKLSAATGVEVSTSLLPDQMLPVDLTFLFQNEYGSISKMALYGVEFMNSGYTLSIEDLILEEVIQFVARDMDPLSDITSKARPIGNSGERELSASDVFKSDIDSYSEWVERVDLRRKF